MVYEKNGKLTRRLYNAFNLRCFVRNLPYTAFTDKTTELQYYDIDHFIGYRVVIQLL